MFLATSAPAGLGVQHNPHHRDLTEAEVTALEMALQDAWSIDRHMTPEGSLGLMITSLDADDDLDMVLYVDAKPSGLTLSILRGDEFEYRGCYDGVFALAAEIRATI